LQILRRLSEETGGVFVEADKHFDLPSGFLDLPFENIDNGGRINIDLSPVIAAGLTASAVQLTFETDVGDILLQVPVKLPIPVRKQDIQAAKPAPAEQVKSSARKITPPPAVTAPIQVITRQAESQEIDLWLWYGVPAALVILIMMVLLTLILLMQSKWSRKSPTDSSQDRPYAYLITQDEMAIRYPITRTIWRVGRSKDNELTLRDNSVSRKHAEIHRKRNGKFDIVDLESANGIYVNDEKITKTNLNEGDKVEIGDIVLQFTQYSSDYSTEDSTEMQKTKAPVTQ
jgi:hypothetical protein